MRSSPPIRRSRNCVSHIQQTERIHGIIVEGGWRPHRARAPVAASIFAPAGVELAALKKRVAACFEAALSPPHAPGSPLGLVDCLDLKTSWPLATL